MGGSVRTLLRLLSVSVASMCCWRSWNDAWRCRGAVAGHLVDSPGLAVACSQPPLLPTHAFSEYICVVLLLSVLAAGSRCAAEHRVTCRPASHRFVARLLSQPLAGHARLPHTWAVCRLFCFDRAPRGRRGGGAAPGSSNGASRGVASYTGTWQLQATPPPLCPVRALTGTTTAQHAAHAPL